jgi:hypothetical protein
MHELWTTPTTNMTYTRSQNYTNVMVGEHEIHHLLLLLSFHVFVPTSAHALLFVDKWIVQIHLKWQLLNQPRSLLNDHKDAACDRTKHCCDRFNRCLVDSTIHNSYNVILLKAYYIDITIFQPIIIQILVTYIEFHISSFHI